jgi:1,4-alpha-glucan branching enzyme
MIPRAVFHRGMEEEIPIIVRNDPWLEPQTEAIHRRTRRFQEALTEIRAKSGSLAAYARGHKYSGIHFNAAANEWTVREWAPEAQAVALIGDFNGWNRESHALSKKDGGVWELKLPPSTLAHGQKVKLQIHGADGSRRDRLPATITRAVQDPVSHDYCHLREPHRHCRRGTARAYLP